VSAKPFCEQRQQRVLADDRGRAKSTEIRPELTAIAHIVRARASSSIAEDAASPVPSGQRGRTNVIPTRYGPREQSVAVDIREVARRSGVSMATVSRALNGRPDVSAATRSRIEEIARRLGYAPNQQARALVRRRSDMVGLIWDTSYVETKGRSPFLSDMLVGLKMALADTGYHLMLLSPQAADHGVNAFVQAAMQHGLDGVVLMGVDADLPALAALINSGRPCVGLDLPVQGSRASYVSSDNVAGAGTAVRHLHGLGHRRIATILGPQSMMAASDRLAGYQAVMGELGLDVPDGYLQEGDFFRESGYTSMQALLALKKPPTAVFAAGDEMAVGAMQAAIDAGLEIARDISIVGYDDIELASIVRPSLTTVSQDYLAIGAAAVTLLTQIIDGELDTPQPVHVPGQLLVRDSAGPVRAAQRRARKASAL
jgi:LacI family transcriptional regulator